MDKSNFDLVTPDGKITAFKLLSEKTADATVFIENISPKFVGYQIPLQHVIFNIKSTLAQLGIDGTGHEIELDQKRGTAQITVHLHAIGQIAIQMLPLLTVGATIGKLFAADERRRVRDPDYLFRMFGRSDRKGRPLLSLGGLQGSADLVLEKIEGRTIAYLTLLNGVVDYDPSIFGFLPTIAKALHHPELSFREILKLHQSWLPHHPRIVEDNRLLLVKTLPLHIRTVFGRVVDDLLTQGYKHTSASILQPDTTASGDIYELFGNSNHELSDIPLEFYTLEPYREYVFFSDRDQLQACIEDSQVLFKAFSTAPEPIEHKAAVFVVKGEQLLNLKPEDWITRSPRHLDLPGVAHGARHALIVERYIEQQASYPILLDIERGTITSQGILLSRYFPSPFMKQMLLGDQIQRCLKGIYFKYPSLSCEGFFSHEDRALLHDLYKFAIPVYWLDEISNKILQYVERGEKESGMFVPLDSIYRFLRSTFFGIYGSNLLSGDFEKELRSLMEGILQLRQEMTHPLLNPSTELALVTGGGPGAMEVGNRVAKELGILSCANIVDFRARSGSVVNEQRENRYIDAKMTYRLDKLVERQAEFHLDFPIFLTGGIGTDFEYCLEEVRRKTGSVPPTPMILFGDAQHWHDKITSRFQANRKAGTIKGSEWLSNCCYCIQTAQQGLEVYRAYFDGTLPIGKDKPIFEEGFVRV